MSSAASRPIRRTMTTTLPVRVVAVALLAAVASFGAATLLPRPPVPAASAADIITAPEAISAPAGAGDPLERVDRAIAVWSGNLERDALDFIAATNLGELYLVRGRLTGDAADYGRGLAAAKQALVANPNSMGARVLHAQVRFAMHDFTGAAEDADIALATLPGLPQALATLGDARLELGDYPGAAEAYAQLGALLAGPAVTARQARLASVIGSLEAGRALAAQARAEAAADPSVSATDRSWFSALAGALAFQAGDLPAATAAYRDALDQWPASPLALAGLARSLAAAGDHPSAIRLYTRAVAIVPQPESLAALGDLQAISGDLRAAESLYRQVRAIGQLGTAAGQLYNRQLVLFLANRGEDPARAVEMAAAELATRRDAYGWDAYAWALLAAGRAGEAQIAMDSARSFDTQDPLLDYHAGMIAAALGDTASARSLLTAALSRNPGFDPLQAIRAQATLDSLAGSRAQP